MRIRSVLISFLFASVFCAAAYADEIRIPIPPLPPPPPVPRFEPPPPPPAPPAPDVVVVVPPPPPFIKIEVAYPDHWFYDDHRGMWFYYGKGHRVHYVKHHVYIDDGRHFFVKSKKWYKVDRDHAVKKGWVKHKKKEKVKKKWW